MMLTFAKFNGLFSQILLFILPKSILENFDDQHPICSKQNMKTDTGGISSVNFLPSPTILKHTVHSASTYHPGVKV